MSYPDPVPPGRKDPGPDGLLRELRVEVPLPRNFQTEVWRRIAVSREQGMAARCRRFTEEFFRLLARPLAASLLVAATAAAGLWTGFSGARAGPDPKLAYVRSVSPFAHAAGGMKP